MIKKSIRSRCEAVSAEIPLVDSATMRDSESGPMSLELAFHDEVASPDFVGIRRSCSKHLKNKHKNKDDYKE